jgi:hypothetical protein
MDVKISITFGGSTPRAWTVPPPDPFGERGRQEIIDLRKAECPYCGFALKKPPSVKTRCSGCKQWMTVRTRPMDNARVVVRADEAEQIDAHWRVARSGREPDFRFLSSKDEVDAERARLRQQLASESGTEPSDDDVKLAVLSGMAARHAADRDWGLYRNVRLMTADFLTRRMKVWEAIRIYLEVCALDLNGATNGNAQKAPELLAEFPEFDPRQAFTAPAVLKQVRLVSARLAINKADLGSCFVEEYGRARVALPLSPEVCWARLEMGFNGPREAETR